ncbi:MAG: hypothetical protein ACYCZF_01470 [Anaerolineae bacterium]
MQTVGLYTDAQTLLDKPDYFERLQRELGLSLVIIGFNGELPGAVLAQTPFEGQPPTMASIKAVLARHLDGTPCSDMPELAQGSVGPHVGRGGDDKALQQAIAQAHRLGLQVWLLAGAWTANDYHTLMFCPNDAQVNTWYEAVFTHLATQYGVEGVDITHARYPMTSEPRGMFLCACERCACVAAELGYDMGRIKSDIKESLQYLRRLDADRLRAVSRCTLGTPDLLQLLGLRSGLLQWFQLRADVLIRNLSRFRTHIHQAAGIQMIFGADTYPSSLALFAGHDQTRWGECSDFASPLISHVDIFVMKTWVAWARFLQQNIAQLTEPEALQLVYRMTGYDSLGLPETIAQMALTEPDCEYRYIPLRDLLALDMAKARLTLPAGLPSYPIIQGGGAPHSWPRAVIERVIEDAARLGHQGVMLQGTTSLLSDV